MNWQPLLQAALSTVLENTPEIIGQKWSNADTTDGKLSNAIQILQDAAAVGGTLEQNLMNSAAAQAPHPALAAVANASA